MESKIQSQEIKFIIENAQNSLNDLKALITKLDEIPNNPIYRRAFIRRLCHLGEALRYFKKDENLYDTNIVLKEIQANESELIIKFIRFRNFFLHFHEHSDEKKNDNFYQAKKYLQENLSKLEKILGDIASNEQVKNGLKCRRKVNNPPVDKSINTILDYAKHIDNEITEMIDTIESNNIDTENISDPDKKYKELALLNYIENICSMIGSYNNRFDEKFEVYNSDQAMKNSFNKLNDGCQDFFLKGANSFRKGIAHNLTKGFDASEIYKTIIRIKLIDEKYIKPVIEHLEKVFTNKIHCNLLASKWLIESFEDLKKVETMFNLSFEAYKLKLDSIRLHIMNIDAKIFIEEAHIIPLLKYEPIIISFEKMQNLLPDDFKKNQFYLSIDKNGTILYSVLTLQGEIKAEQPLERDSLVAAHMITKGNYNKILNFLKASNTEGLKENFLAILNITDSRNHTSPPYYWTKEKINDKNLKFFDKKYSSFEYRNNRFRVFKDLFSEYFEIKKNNFDLIIKEINKLEKAYFFECMVKANEIKNIIMQLMSKEIHQAEMEKFSIDNEKSMKNSQELILYKSFNNEELKFFGEKIDKLLSEKYSIGNSFLIFGNTDENLEKSSMDNKQTQDYEKNKDDGDVTMKKNNK